MNLDYTINTEALENGGMKVHLIATGIDGRPFKQQLNALVELSSDTVNAVDHDELVEEFSDILLEAAEKAAEDAGESAFA